MLSPLAPARLSQFGAETGTASSPPWSALVNLDSAAMADRLQPQGSRILPVSLAMRRGICTSPTRVTPASWYCDAQSEEEMVRGIESPDWKPVDFVVERSHPRSDSITLPSDLTARVKRIAEKQGVSHQTPMQQWIQERLQKERALG